MHLNILGITPAVILSGLLAWASCTMAQAAPYAHEVFDVPDADHTFANGINERGDVVGGYNAAGSTTLSGFTRVNGLFTTTPDFYPLDISTSGIRVGVNPQAGFTGVVIDIDGSRNLVGPTGSTFWRPEGINDAGQITGYMHTASAIGLGFVWDGVSVSTLSSPPATGLQVRNGNTRGQLVGSYSIGPVGAMTDHGFLWENGGFTEILYPGAIETLAWGINDGGAIVGAATLGDGTVKGFVRDSLGHYEVLGLAGWSSGLAEDINNQGQVVGNYFDGTRTRGFVATPLVTSTPVALPSTALLAALGLAALGLLRPSKHRGP